MRTISWNFIAAAAAVLAASLTLMGCQGEAVDTLIPTQPAELQASATPLPPTGTDSLPADTVAPTAAPTSTTVPTVETLPTDANASPAVDIFAPTGVPTLGPTETPIPTLIPSTGTGSVSYAFYPELTTETLEMTSPATVITMSFPESYRWAINSATSSINLVYDAYRRSLPDETALALSTGTLNVFVDGYLAASVTPDVGTNQVLQVPIPAQAVEDTNDTEHTLQLIYYDRQLCEIGGRSGIVIHGDSNVSLQYDILPTTADLATFPRPLYEENVAGEAVLIIIPDQYNQNDIKSALAVAATLGRDSYGGVPVYLRTVTTATPAELSTYSAILIGSPDRNALITGLYQQNALPTYRQIDGGISTLTGQLLASDVGVVQEIISPRNSTRVWVIATGQTDAGVLRAARALSSPTPSFGFEGNLALIEDVLELPEEMQGSSLLQEPEVTLADLGFTDTVIDGIGTRSMLITFFVPANWAVQDASLTLNYLSSSALSVGSSGITLEMNGNPVGSVRLGGEDSNENSVVFSLPREDIFPGENNELRIRTNLELEGECTAPDSDLAWVRIRDTSILHIEREVRAFAAQGTVNDPIGALLSQPDLSDLAIVLPESTTPTELQAAAQVVWLLGERSRGSAFNPEIYLGNVQESDLIDKNVIAIGLPSTNPAYALLQDNLFQPFDLETNRMIQQVGNLVYELPDNFSLGVIQSIVAPWDSSRAITLVGGTNNEGLIWAINAIINPEQRYQIDRSLTFIRDTRIESLDASASAQGMVVSSVENVIGDEAELTTIVVTDTPQIPGTAGTGGTGAVSTQPAVFAPDANGLSPLILGASLVMVLIGAGLGLFGFLRNRRKNQSSKDDNQTL